MQMVRSSETPDDAEATIVGNARSNGLDQAGLVHDLGNLMQVVTSALNIIGNDVETAKSSTLAQVVVTAKASLDRANALIRQSMTLMRAPIASAPAVDVQACLVELATAICSLAGPAICLELRIAAELPPIACDRLALENAVLNLAINARDAMQGDGLLVIGASLQPGPAGEMVRLSVSDNGCGMSADTKARALDAFFTTKGASGGSGVGLAMVMRFAKAAGGTVQIDSEPNLGTTVAILVPAGR